MSSVAILDGFAEGKWHSKKLRSALITAGYALESDVSKADIIIAHSGGCFYVPEATQGQKVILVGPPYWPGKSPLKSMLEKVYFDMKYRTSERNYVYFIQKTFWNIVYLLADIPRAVSISKAVRLKKLVKQFNKSSCTVVRNQDDAWCTPHIQTELNNESATFHELPGEHDDCWIHPDKYIEILNQS